MGTYLIFFVFTNINLKKQLNGRTELFMSKNY